MSSALPVNLGESDIKMFSPPPSSPLVMPTRETSGSTISVAGSGTPQPIKTLGDRIWYEQIDILWDTNRLTEFFPSSDQTLEERFNSLVRLGIYVSIILYYHHGNYRYLYIGVGVMLFTYIIHKQNPKNLGTEGVSRSTIEKFENADVDTGNGGLGNPEYTQPTLDNPFMNPTMKDYMNVDEDGKIKDRPKACDVNNPVVKRKVDELFNNNLYRDVDDIFGKMNSQRQFFTMPYTTIPNKQDEFARWLYLNPKTCKEDGDYCLRYEDVRAKRPDFYESSQNPVETTARTKGQNSIMQSITLNSSTSRVL